jgi:YtkA-like
LLPRGLIRAGSTRAASRHDHDIRGNFDMKTFKLARPVRAAFIAIAMIGSTGLALADIKDYEFKLVEPTVAVGKDKIVTVQLVNTKTGKPVPDAVIFASRLDMAPEGMPEMATKIVREPGGEPGSYRFKAAFGMEGRWRLSLGAKVQGETGTVESKLVITAQK